MNVEAFIRDSAARGLSRRAVAAALGISMWKLRSLLTVMPSVNWPAPGQSIDFRRASAARRGQHSPAAARALSNARAARRNKALHAVRGTTGTVEELVQLFDVEVSASTVRRRLQAGQSISDALFTPRQPWCRPNQRAGAPASAPRALSAWERLDVEHAGAPPPMCM